MKPLLAGVDFELHLLAFGETLEAVHLDRGEMDKHIFSVVLFNEAVSLGVIEPLHLPSCHARRLLRGDSLPHRSRAGQASPAWGAYIGRLRRGCQESRVRRPPGANPPVACGVE